METMNVNYSSFRQELASWLDRVSEDHVPARITRKSGESCVLMSESDYSALVETLYLLSSANNAERLNKSLKEYENGKTNTHDIDWEAEDPEC